MEKYYAQQPQLSLFTGSARQRGSGFVSSAVGVGLVALPFAKTLLLIAVMSIAKELLSQSIPELPDVTSKKKTSKQAVRSVKKFAER